MIDLLIITSCINPPEQAYLKLTDGKIRYAQTIESLRFYMLSKMFRKIVLCDGSGYAFEEVDIVCLAKSNNVELELLTFQQDFNMVKKKGKGYGEGQIMEYIVRHSVLFPTCSFFLKITGRLKVLNIIDLVSKLSSSKNYFNIFQSRYIGCVDTRIYGMSTTLYKTNFINAYKNVNDTERRSYEFCFTDVLKSNCVDYSCFPVVPQILGFSGTGNVPYRLDSIYYLECLLTNIHLMNTKFASYLILLLSCIKKIFR